MPQQGGGGAELLKQQVSRGSLVRLLALGLGGSLSEGVGLVLLVPILQLVDGASGGGSGGVAGGRLRDFYTASGLPLRLDLLLGLFVALVVLRGGLVQARANAEQRLQGEILHGLRDRLFTALLRAGWRHSGQIPSAALAAALTGLTDRAAQHVQFALALLAAGLTLATMLGAALLIAALPTLALGLAGVLVMGAYAGLRRRARREGEALNAGYTGYFAFVSERLAALRLVKAFGVEPDEAARADRLAGALATAHAGYAAGIARGQFVLNAGAAAALAVVVWLGSARWHMDTARLLPLIALFARCVPLFQAVQTGWQQVAHLAPALDELAAMIAAAEGAAEPPAGAGPVPATSPALTREIRLEGVTLRHEGRAAPALDAVSLALPAGVTLLVSGPSGAGKSTLADVLAGLVPPDAGSMLIDGQPLVAGALAAWRRRVAYVQQEPVLFAGTLRENLAWAMPGASEAEMVVALEQASAGFVLDLPHGLDTKVGERGARLSGGERQRIALARGLLRRPDLLILDEVTSALDAENEAAVARAVAGLKGRLTIVIIGHRGALSTLADLTLHLDRGRAVTSGDTLRA
jgi:ATP-binding cassette subfamily C protein